MSIKKYYFLAKKTLFPLNRSLTGKGIKQTLKIIKNEFPKLKIKKSKLEQKFLIGKFLKNGIYQMLS